MLALHLAVYADRIDIFSFCMHSVYLTLPYSYFLLSLVACRSCTNNRKLYFRITGNPVQSAREHGGDQRSQQ